MKVTACIISLLLCATVASLANEYKIGAYINGAPDCGLYFGRGASAFESPAPPFCGMFKIEDIYLISQNDSPAEWYDRLGEQLLTTDGPWAIAVNCNAKLEFKAAAGTIPANAWISYNDPKKGTFQAVKLIEGTTFNFKTGTIVNITVGNKPTALAISTDSAKDRRIFVTKSNVYRSAVRKYTAVTPFAVNGNTLTITFVAGISKIYYAGEVGAEANADWIFSVADGAYYSWNSDRTVLSVNLDDFVSGDVDIVMTANRASANPVSTTISDNSSTSTFIWIVQKFGSLDIDGDGLVTGADALYLYWFVNAGCPGEDKKWFTPDCLIPFTEGIGNPTAALANMRENLNDYNFDEDNNGVTNDDAMYFYWFVAAGCPGAEGDWFTPDDLTAFTEGIGNPVKALENLRDMNE